MERRAVLLTAIVGGLAFTAFSRPVRQKILERDNFRCVICGSTEHLEAGHISHDKSSPRYDDPSNGRILCTEDHLKDHINRHGRNGLSKQANEWAIKQLEKRSGVIYQSE